MRMKHRWIAIVPPSSACARPPPAGLPTGRAGESPGSSDYRRRVGCRAERDRRRPTRSTSTEPWFLGSVLEAGPREREQRLDRSFARYRWWPCQLDLRILRDQPPDFLAPPRRWPGRAGHRSGAGAPRIEPQRWTWPRRDRVTRPDLHRPVRLVVDQADVGRHEDAHAAGVRVDADVRRVLLLPPMSSPSLALDETARLAEVVPFADLHCGAA